jgi:UDP-N-acetylmuramyl pentapeptide phosphotransferase/UDP-N-acetylglucosamine-1-phosphate transferase
VIIAVFAGAAAVMSALITFWLSKPASPLYVLDHPNERSLHSEPTPRTGGVAIVTTVLAIGTAFALYRGEYSYGLLAIASSMTLVAAMSLADDRYRVHAGLRFASHVAAALLIVSAGFVADNTWLPGTYGGLAPALTNAATLLFVVWMVDLYNFMDGIDGFAGGMSVIGFGTMALLALIAGQNLLAGLVTVVAAAAFGFLVLNFPPARIFMGDVGSATLGLLAAAFSLWGSQSGAFPLWAAVLIFSPFIVDATVTLLRRALRRERVWEAHSTHYYQRLVQAGWSHRKVVLWEYTLMLMASASALWGVPQSDHAQWILLSLWAFAYAVLAWAVARKIAARRNLPFRAEFAK